METARLELPGTPVAPSVARLFVRNLCQEWGAEAVCDVAELLSSELVTNAVVHARSSVELEAAYDDCERLAYRRLRPIPGRGRLVAAPVRRMARRVAEDLLSSPG